MSYQEKDIVHEAGGVFVLRQKKPDRYTVFVAGICYYATSDSSFELDEDGLSIARARCDYLAARPI